MRGARPPIAAVLALLLSMPCSVESKVNDLAPYIPPKPEGVFRCYEVKAQVYSNGDADTNCGEAECTVTADGERICKTGLQGEPSNFHVKVCAVNEENATSYANMLVGEALRQTDTASCQGNYTQLCASSAGNFTPITDRQTGTDRCCKYPRLMQERQKYWKSMAEGWFEPCAVCSSPDDATAPTCGSGGSGDFKGDACNAQQTCECGGGFESNFRCNINGKEYPKLTMCVDDCISAQGAGECAPYIYTYFATALGVDSYSLSLCSNVWLGISYAGTAVCGYCRAHELTVNEETPLETWEGLRVNLTNDKGESFIHKITYYEVSSGRTLLRFDPKVEPEDMNKAPHLWNFTVQDAVMEEYPVESSFGEHVMCYKDEDCLDVRETMQNIEGVASVGMCCEYCTTLLAGKMCKGEWEQWPIGSSKYFETTAAAVETCRKQLACVDKLPCIGCPLTCRPETEPPTTTTPVPTTTPPPETTPPPPRSTVMLDMTVPGQTTVGWYDDRPEKALKFMTALSHAIDIAVVFLDVMPPPKPLPEASSLPPILVRVTTPNDLTSQRFLALIRKAFTVQTAAADDEGDDRRQDAPKSKAVKILESYNFVGVTLDSSRALALDGTTALEALICGDGKTQAEIDEECDDGNDVGGDGCSSDCVVEQNWHCFHCQIEDNMCNGTDTVDGCSNQGCDVGKSLCREVDVCTLWYGRCYQSVVEQGDRCWACMDFVQDECLDCTPGYSIQTPKTLTRMGTDAAWALTRGNLEDQPLPKWYAPYGFRGACEPDPSSRGKKGPHPASSQIGKDAPDFPEDETGMSGDDPPFIPYGRPPICLRWKEVDRIIYSILCFSGLMFILAYAYFCFSQTNRRIARQKQAISRPDLPRPKIWRPTIVPGEDDVSSDELSDMEEEEALIPDGDLY